MKQRLKLFSLILTVIGLVLSLVPTVVHAQLSCENPPPPFDNPDLLANIQSVWDLTDFCQFQDGVLNEIISGGVPRDGIPPIDNPTFDPISVADEWLQPQSPVISVEIDGQARAYPLAILTRHEIVNDELAGIPIAVTFCPLCNSAIVFDRRIDGEVHRFGVSGLLRNSDLIMWDDITQSWWQQFTGEGLLGSYTERFLDIVPSQVVGYGQYKEQFPEGEVLSNQGRDYGRNGYVGYDSNPQPFLFAGVPDNRLFPVERVLGVNINEMQMAYTFESLSEEIVINDALGDTAVVAMWQPGSTSALDASDIDSSKDVGSAGLFNRDLNGQVLTFSVADGVIVDDQTGSTWNVFGTATAGELAGSQLTQINAFPHFWFAWAAFHPETEIYDFQPPSEEEIGRLDLDPFLGNPDAPVTIIEYGAYGCPACRFWHEQGIIDDILNEFPGQVKFIFRDMPVIIPTWDRLTAELAQCALDQGQDLFWEYHDVLYTVARQGQSSRDELIDMGGFAGLDTEALRACADSGIHVETVNYDFNRGNQAGVRGTPTFFVNGEQLFNAHPDVLREMIREALNAQGG